MQDQDQFFDHTTGTNRYEEKKEIKLEEVDEENEDQQLLIEKEKDSLQELQSKQEQQENLWKTVFRSSKITDYEISPIKKVLLEDYFDKLNEYDYPMISRLVLFLITTSVFTLTITLICVLCFRWEENTIWWSTGGVLFFTLLFIFIVSYDKKEYIKRRDAYEQERRNIRDADEEQFRKEKTVHDQSLKFVTSYVEEINNIHDQSQILYYDTHPKEGANSVDFSIYDSVERIVKKGGPFIIQFCNTFKSEADISTESYKAMNKTEKLDVIKNVLQKYVYASWMLKTSNVAKQLSIIEDAHLKAFKDLREDVNILLQNDLICSHISQIVNVNGSKLFKSHIQDAFRAPQLKYLDEQAKLEAIEKQLYTIQNIYRDAIRVLSNPNLVQSLELKNDGKIQIEKQQEKKSGNHKRNASQTRKVIEEQKTSEKI